MPSGGGNAEARDLRNIAGCPSVSITMISAGPRQSLDAIASSSSGRKGRVSLRLGLPRWRCRTCSRARPDASGRLWHEARQALRDAGLYESPSRAQWVPYLPPIKEITYDPRHYCDRRIARRIPSVVRAAGRITRQIGCRTARRAPYFTKESAFAP